MKINLTTVRALVKRDLGMYFSNPTGYVFITLFIFLSAAAAFWRERFFLNNLANLDLLNSLFPLLLLLFIPTLTMGVWANERKEGTDELLLTLPATDLEIVIGKYLAAVGIYTASLVLSISHIGVLLFLGSPDLGLMLANYVGYWLIGAGLIAVGMLASLLTPNITIAFVLGAFFCSIFVFISSIFTNVDATWVRGVSMLGVVEHFNDYGRGVMSLSGFLYFASLTLVMVYLNTVLLGRRHWPPASAGYRMWLHHLVRVLALIVIIVSINIFVNRVPLRWDATAEKLHSLSEETEKLLASLDENRPVFIQAYLSEDVPQHYVQQRENLIGFIKEIDAVAGRRVEASIIKTEPFSPEAREAREKFGIVAQEIPNLSSARAGLTQVFMGVAMTCGADEEVITFFDRGLPVEYELTRSIRVVARTERKKIGVLTTEAKLFGGFDFNTMQTSPPWPVVAELKKQYEVVQISASSPIEEELDGLLVALPSALPQGEMDNLLAYIEKGVPTLLLIDPLPIVNIGLAPMEQAGANRNPFMQNQQAPPTPKGDIEKLLNTIGISWNKAHVVWDGYNPHPDLAQLPPEIVFIGVGNGNPVAFNDKHQASSGLQEAVFLYGGTIQKASGSSYEFTPLLETSQTSGLLSYQELVQRGFFGAQLVTRGHKYRPNNLTYTVAAHVQGEKTEQAAAEEVSPLVNNINLIVISDLDFVSDQFFEIRKRGIGNLNFDNITFFLNCMDTLVGDDSFVTLRKRRVKHRTLETVEARTQQFIAQRAEEEKEAEIEADKALSDAQQRLDEKIAAVERRTDLDGRTKQIMSDNLQEMESRRFEVLKANIEAEKAARIQASKEYMEGQIQSIQSRIKTFAILLPPVPVFLIGLMIFFRRRKRELEGAVAARKLRS
jgi:ABC-2 type transport system permease protein